MEMEGDCLGNRLWKWKGTVWVTTEQPLGNRLWKWKGTA